jgi:hypothetical protein
MKRDPRAEPFSHLSKSSLVAHEAGKMLSPAAPFCWPCWDYIAMVRAALALRELDGPAWEAAGDLALYNDALAGVRRIRATQARRRIVRAVRFRWPESSLAEITHLLGFDRETVEKALAEG